MARDDVKTNEEIEPEGTHRTACETLAQLACRLQTRFRVSRVSPPSRLCPTFIQDWNISPVSYHESKSQSTAKIRT